ncbi:hypothetical protein CspeluHIS016_0105020 [Cutaneotrichosporon spelunceum]|uniref:Uncharacterized protein n=1 Tax=Cutaneotrichosporon spelunceum TaxID=1672016 RepID=A0AAD3Y864_9TREE|nr:hypothetical protein CspeluHIS016_0105020 [Cutaneotrichosporon spelunceum]
MFKILDSVRLQDEIDRLNARCKAHEQRFRSSRSSFEHRVFSEFPSALGRLGDLDARAEKCTVELYGAMNTAVPKLETRLQALVDERDEDVEEMHKRTSPWLTFEGELDTPKHPPVGANKAKGIGKITRIRTRDGEPDDLAQLAKFEQMADEVEEYLQEELARLERKIDIENLKRAVGFWAIISVLTLILAYYVGQTLWRTACRVTGWCQV